MTAPEFKIDPASTALVLIDLQKGIAALPVQGNSAASVLTNARALIDAFRAAGAPVVLVKVAFPVGASSLKPSTDAPPAAATAEPPGWTDFCPELGVQASDIVVLKRQWGAFYGTDLDLQLRRRGIGTLVLGLQAIRCGRSCLKADNERPRSKPSSTS